LYDLTAEAILTQKFFRIDQIHKKLKYYKTLEKKIGRISANGNA
jgi:hypothetical protein